jgi:hypothetical protein
VCPVHTAVMSESNSHTVRIPGVWTVGRGVTVSMWQHGAYVVQLYQRVTPCIMCDACWAVSIDGQLNSCLPDGLMGECVRRVACMSSAGWAC